MSSAKLYENVEIPAFDRDTLPNPLVGTYPTKDGRFIILVLLQADRYWPDLCAHLERPDLLDDPRFKDAAARYEHRRECIQVLRDVFRTRTYDEWRERLRTLEGVWAPLQTPLEVHDDPQAIANGYLEEITASNGAEFRLPANPVQFDETTASVRRAPEHGEHTDEVLMELGLSYEEIIDRKVSGAVLAATISRPSIFSATTRSSPILIRTSTPCVNGARSLASRITTWSWSPGTTKRSLCSATQRRSRRATP